MESSPNPKEQQAPEQAAEPTQAPQQQEQQQQVGDQAHDDDDAHQKEGPDASQITARLHALLKDADLNTLTERQVRKQLEKDLGVDLSTRKELIKKEIDAWLESGQQEEQEDGEEEEEEEDEEEGEEVNNKSSGKRKSRSSGGGRGGFGKACLLSPALSALVGAETMARSQVVKALWDYIKKHNLQDPKNKRNILCDEKLKTVFTPPINMFSMNKQLSKHCYQADGPPASPSGSDEEEEGSEGEVPRTKKAKQAKKKSTGSPKSGEKKKSGGGGGGGFIKPVQLQESLAAFLGGETSMSRPEITKRFWTYFKEHNLQNPSDKREIICNDELKRLLGVDKFQGFGLQKLLKPLISN